MHRLIASSCLHIINHFHSSEPWQAAEWRGNMTTWDGPWRSGYPLILLAQVFPFLKKQTNHPFIPHSPCLLPSPLLFPFPASFSKESSILVDSISLSRPLLVHYRLHHLSNTTCPRPLSMILCPTPGPDSTLPSTELSQEPELCPCSPFSISFVSGTSQVL